MDAGRLSTVTLAYLGDAVYEHFVRERLVRSGDFGGQADLLHKAGVHYVNAASQAEVLKMLMPRLSEEEAAIVRRARNHRVATKPKNADPVEYKNATAFEALIGYLRLSGKGERCTEIMELAAEYLEEGK